MKILVLKNTKTGKYRKIKARTIFMPHVKIEKDMIGDCINSEEFIVKIIEREVKKVKYFETIVKKIKVEKKADNECKEYDPLWCGKCSRIPKQKKGNWINGENLDKIKFPCFCSFVYCGEKYYGQINNSGVGEHRYQLINIGEQTDANEYRRSNSLKELIKSQCIKILKGKIIIFEEE